MIMSVKKVKISYLVDGVWYDNVKFKDLKGKTCDAILYTREMTVDQAIKEFGEFKLSKKLYDPNR